ncbi:hypothetical protein JCM10213_007469 [Rhodosporidiobolus nylandii]
MLSLTKIAVTAASMAALGRSQVVPTAPGPNDVFRWNLDTTNTWTNFSITLKTGANLNMITLEEVVSGLDGTTGTGEYSWTCPEVTPNSKIYFYAFEQAGEDQSWTTRFTIAAADGSTTDPTNTTDGIAWGTGRLVGTSSSGSSDSSSSAAAGSGPASSASSSASSASSSASSVASSASSSAATAAASSVTSATPSRMITVTSTASQQTAEATSEASSAASSATSAASAAAASASAGAQNDNTSGAGRLAAAGVLGMAGAAVALFA